MICRRVRDEDDIWALDLVRGDWGHGIAPQERLEQNPVQRAYDLISRDPKVTDAGGHGWFPSEVARIASASPMVEPERAVAPSRAAIARQAAAAMSSGFTR
jgi:hypothetical protein